MLAALPFNRAVTAGLRLENPRIPRHGPRGKVADNSGGQFDNRLRQSCNLVRLSLMVQLGPRGRVMARTPSIKAARKRPPTTINVEKAADFRALYADACVPVGSGRDVTIILTRTEPGLMVQTLGDAVGDEVNGTQQVKVTNSHVDVAFVQVGHVTIGLETAAELAGSLIKMIEMMDADLLKQTLERFGLSKA